MRRNLKRVASLILSTLVVAQLIPTLAFAASDPASPLVKEPGYHSNSGFRLYGCRRNLEFCCVLRKLD